jgi:hypothetical protein
MNEKDYMLLVAAAWAKTAAVVSASWGAGAWEAWTKVETPAAIEKMKEAEVKS